MRRQLAILVTSLVIIFFATGLHAQEPLAPPIISADNVSLLSLVYEFSLSSEETSWIENPVPNAGSTSTPTAVYYDPPAPEMIISTDGSRAALTYASGLNRIFLIDLLRGVWRPLVLPATLNLHFSPDLSWLAVNGRWVSNGDNILRVWQLDDLFATGGSFVATAAPPLCQATISVGSTTLRAQPSLEGAALGYPLQNEVFPVLAMSRDLQWLQVNVDGQQGWLNADVTQRTESCSATPVLLNRGTETFSRALLSRERILGFSAGSPTLLLHRYGGLTAISMPRGDEVLFDVPVSLSWANSQTQEFMRNVGGLYVMGNQIFDSSTLQFLSTLENVRPSDNFIVDNFSPDASRIFVNSGGLGYVYDVRSGRLEKRITLIDSSQMTRLRWSPDGRYLLLEITLVDRRDSRDPQIRRDVYLLDLNHEASDVLITDSPAVTVIPGTQPFNWMDFGLPYFTPDSNRIVLDVSSTTWDIASESLIPGAPPVDEEILDSVVFPQNDGHLYRTNRRRGNFEAQDVTGQSLASLQLNGYSAVFDQSGRWLVNADVSGSRIHSISLWAAVGEAAARTPVPTRTATPSSTLRPTIDYTQLAGTSTPSVTPSPSPEPPPSATLLPSSTRMPTETPELPAATSVPTPQPPSFAPVLSADNADDIRLLHIFETMPSRYYPIPLGFNDDGRLFAITGGNEILVWSTDTGEIVRRYAMESDASIVSAAMTRDFRRVVISNSNGTLYVLQLQPDNTFDILYSDASESNTFWTREVYLSPDGSQFASLERDSSGQYYLLARNTDTGSEAFFLTASPQVRFTFVGQNTITVNRTRHVVLYIGGQWVRSFGVSNTDFPSYFSVDSTYQLGAYTAGNGNIYLSQFGTPDQPDPPLMILQGHLCPIDMSSSGLAIYFSADNRWLLSVDTCGQVLYWEVTTGTRVAPEMAATAFARGVPFSDWMFIDAQGAPVFWRTNILSIRGQATLSADGSTLAVRSGNRVLLFGIPSDERPAYGDVLGRVMPETVNVRAEPSLDAPVIGLASRGSVVISGRDESGQFYYLPAYAGWANADIMYITLLDNSPADLPVRTRDEPG
ncbi:MAG: hypothetical protein KME04_04970 [Pleurocapsa minor GSE-CHR-MK-17-07R]|jgi:WD40 repeat protein|nr:hypothetical protein [Pleurocapsa minor GSE-CHR-MK 17-07R]